MSFSPPLSPMAFTFRTHQSTSPFIFCCEINASSTLSRKRALADPSPSGPSRKKRRLRLALTTSPLSLPFSTPRASSQPDRTSNHHRRTAVLIFRPSQRLPQPRASASSSSSSSSCSLLRKAAVLNRVQQRMDAACQRNPNLRWEKEQRQERELLLKEGVQMRCMAALKDVLLSPVMSTRPVGSPAGDVVPGHYSDPRRRLAATSHYVDDCERRCNEEKENAGGPHAAAASMWCCSKTDYPTPPPSAVGLSNYDALDSEEEEKDDAAVPLPSMPQQPGDAATPVSESAGVADEGMRDIFDFLTPPAMHRSFLSDFDDGEGGEGDDAVPGPSSVSVSTSVHPDYANDAANNNADDIIETASSADTVAHANGDEHEQVGGRLPQHHARAAPLKPGAHCVFQRCQSAPPVSRHHQHYTQHYHHHHHHHRRHERQHHCAMAATAAAAAFVAVPRAY